MLSGGIKYKATNHSDEINLELEEDEEKKYKKQSEN